jgi:AcrR family transcriptional regulator
MYNRAMPLAAATAEAPSRTQAERRAATRAAILDAAVDCLSEEGYANTTTRRIAERAGVTPGALQHHFATKAELLGNARRQLGKRLAQELVGYGSVDVPSIELRTELLIDHFWELLKSPLFAAMIELWVAARTDPELRGELIAAEQDGARLVAATVHALYTEIAEKPGFGDLIASGRATLRGLAMARFVDDSGTEQAWPVIRAQLLERAAEFRAHAGVSS